jgi:hypothetical protein
MKTLQASLMLLLLSVIWERSAIGQTSQSISEPVAFSHVAGFYPEPFLLTLSSPDAEATILYTLDGSEPQSEGVAPVSFSYKNRYPENPGDPYGDFLTSRYRSHVYTQSLLITDRSSDENILTAISSTFYPNTSYNPRNPVMKGTVVKARLVKTGYEPGPVTTHTFFVRENPFGLPVISLSLAPDLLFDYEKGIYVAGKDFDDWRATNPQKITDAASATNYLRDLEYPAHVELFDDTSPQKVIDQKLGLKTSGNSSLFWPQKSLRLFARKEYGKSNIEYAFFPGVGFDIYKRITLRNSGNDNQITMFRDAAIHETVKHLNFGTQAYRPSVVFINGEYWGVHNLREHLDKNYLAAHYNIDPENIDLLEGLEEKEGDRMHYLSLINYVKENDLTSQEKYDYVQTQIDIESFTDYEISEIFAGNIDWPGVNTMCWRTRTNTYDPDAPAAMDGRWRWLLKDTDFGFGLSASYTHNTLAYATDPSGDSYRNVWWSTILLQKLLTNHGYKEKFVNRFSDLLNSTFLPERIGKVIERLKSGIESEMPRHIMRWNAPRNTSMWQHNVDEMKRFVNERPYHQRRHIAEYLQLKAQHEISVTVTGHEHGYIRINSLDLIETTEGVSTNPYPWKGTYFEGIPVSLQAIANPGSRFVKWIGAELPENDHVKINLTDDVSLTAVFVKDTDEVSRFNPLNGSAGVPAQTVFEWQGVPGQLYHLQVSTSAGFENLIINQSGISGSPFSPPENLQISTTYYWRIKDGQSDEWTEPWIFTTGKDLIMSAEQKIEAVSLYPNPSHDALTIELQASTSIRSLAVVDILGRPMYAPMTVDDRTVRLDVSAFPKGMYILLFKRQNDTIVQKHFIVDR